MMLVPLAVAVMTPQPSLAPPVQGVPLAIAATDMAAPPAVSVPVPVPTPAPVAVAAPVSDTAPPPAGEAAPDFGEDIVVTASRSRGKDPLRAVNLASFQLTQKVDAAIIAPVAHAYERVTPRPLRTGARNFLRNLREPIAFANFLLQLKFGKAAETVGRFAINTTIGILGVTDVARRCPFNLPYRPNGFSDTLGVYGVKEGPYLFLPLIGPTTVRDIVGGAVDGIASPLVLGGPFRSPGYIAASNAFRVLNQRVEMDDELRQVRESDDPYAARREQYLEKRRDRIERLKGNDGATTEQSDAVPSDLPPAGTTNTCVKRKKKVRPPAEGAAVF